MSPVFGIGINLAIQDAVAAARLLARPLREGRNTSHLLNEVQRRREFRTRLTQALQVIAHTGFQYVFRRQGPLHAPWPLRLVARAHVLQPILLRVVGIGTVPEHVDPTAASQPRMGNRVATLISMGAGIAAAAVVGWRVLRRAA